MLKKGPQLFLRAAWCGVFEAERSRCSGLEASFVATVDRSLMRGLGTDLSMNSSRGCLALSSSVGLKAALDEGRGLPFLRLASRPMHRRCPRWWMKVSFLLAAIFLFFGRAVA